MTSKHQINLHAPEFRQSSILRDGNHIKNNSTWVLQFWYVENPKATTIEINLRGYALLVRVNQIETNIVF